MIAKLAAGCLADEAVIAVPGDAGIEQPGYRRPLVWIWLYHQQAYGSGINA